MVICLPQASNGGKPGNWANCPLSGSLSGLFRSRNMKMYSNESWPRFTIFADPYVVKRRHSHYFWWLRREPREETQLEGSEFAEWSGLSLSVITAGTFFIAGNVRDATRSGELTVAAFMYSDGRLGWIWSISIQSGWVSTNRESTKWKRRKER